MKDWKKDFSFTKDVGLCFLETTKTIIRRKMYTKWKKKQKEKQLIKRGRYVEFNLLYDRGTRFGLHTGGNVETFQRIIFLPRTLVPRISKYDAALYRFSVRIFSKVWVYYVFDDHVSMKQTTLDIQI